MYYNLLLKLIVDWPTNQPTDIDNYRAANMAKNGFKDIGNKGGNGSRLQTKFCHMYVKLWHDGGGQDKH